MGLLGYTLRRLLMLVPTFIGFILIVFALVQMLPINRRAMLFIRDPIELRNISEVIKKYGLDQPVYVQFASGMSQVLQGNLGWSEMVQEPVLRALLRRLPATLELILYFAPIIILLGILGVQSAKKQGKPIDHISRTVTTIGWTFPSFWLGIVLLAVFYAGLKWFGPGRYGNEVLRWLTAPNCPWQSYTGFMTIDSLLNGQLWILADVLRHLVLPVTVLVISNMAIVVKAMRWIMLRTLKKRHIAVTTVMGSTQNEVTKKRMQGMRERATTLSGVLFASMFTSIIVTETVFMFPGVGQFAAQAALRLDTAPIIGLTLLLGFFLIIANLMVDIVYACIDYQVT